MIYRIYIDKLMEQYKY